MGNRGAERQAICGSLCGGNHSAAVTFGDEDAGINPAGATSQVVGYLTDGLTNGFKSTGCSFATIGQNGCGLSTIKPIGISKASAAQIKIQLLNNAGVMQKRYYFYQGQTRGNFQTDGWYDCTASTVKGDLITKDADVEFDPGQGFWVNAASNKLGLKFSMGLTEK